MDVDCGSARDRLGRTLGGKYTLREVLGAGGTAVVYRAQALDQSQVAIKVLHDHLSRSEEVCRRFVREGQLGNVLEHPGTVKVLDHGSTDDGCPYLVLEFLEGESLEERRVRLGGRLDLWETLDFCDQLLAVLEIAHAKGIVHRDIKPSNLFVTKIGRLKVLDFGIARLVDDTSSTSTKTGQTVGTPAFMPPEQALSRPRDIEARTDIWAVGATLFTLLSGEHVHIAETSSEHLVKAATLHARSLAKALPGVPANVEALVAKCLSFDKDERWDTAAQMRQELSAVRADPGRRIGTTSAPPPERNPSSPNMPTIIRDTSSARLRAYTDAPTTYSEPKMPISGPISSGQLKVPTPASDRYIDSVANMALSSNPGAYDLFPRKKWVLPVAMAITALCAITVTALFFAFRATAPVQVVSASSPTVTVAPPPPIPAPSPVETATAAPSDAVVEIEEPATSATTANQAAAPTTAMATPPAPVHVGATPPATTQTAAPKKSRKDLYKPF